MLAIANREGRILADRTAWSALVREATFTQSASALQGTLDDDGSTGLLSDNDYGYILGSTMWNRTTDLPILGNVNSRDWQTLQAFPVTGPYQQYKIRGKSLYFDPVGANATDTIAFEYKSKFWAESSGGTRKAKFDADDDEPLLDQHLMTLGIEWRWYKYKGLDYSESFMEYERAVLDYIGRDTGKTRIRLDGGPNHRVPGVMVPQGSWNIS